MMRNRFFIPKTAAPQAAPFTSPNSAAPTASTGLFENSMSFAGYWSDASVVAESSDEEEEGWDTDEEDADIILPTLPAASISLPFQTDPHGTDNEDIHSPTLPSVSSSPSLQADHLQSMHIQLPPPLKRRRLDVSVKTMKEQAKVERAQQYSRAYDDINKIITSKKFKFEGGEHGLQAIRARAIRSTLGIVVSSKVGQRGRFIGASKAAALSYRFAESWGGRMIRQWCRVWIAKRDLPKSKRGKHRKAVSLVDDPAIAAELRDFVRSNKWAMDPKKLAAFSKDTLVPMAMRSDYFKKVFDNELPAALMRYLEVELFPRIHVKPSRGWGISTCRRMLRALGFKYTEHAKGLYFDGHERSDVVDYRQNVFLPAMGKLRSRLVRYEVGDVDKEVPMEGSGRPLVLVAHDEMTAQANDGKKKSWIMDGEQPLRKKGVGRGIHQSDVICSTVGWLEEGSQTLEYGKNYEGYWTGELFVEQVR